MTDLPRATMHVSVGGIDWDGSEPKIHVEGPYSAGSYIVHIGQLSIVCHESTARRLYTAIEAALLWDKLKPNG